jgi:hypothetical protein
MLHSIGHPVAGYSSATFMTPFGSGAFQVRFGMETADYFLIGLVSLSRSGIEILQRRKVTVRYRDRPHVDSRRQPEMTTAMQILMRLSSAVSLV